MRMPDEGATAWDDLIRGRIEHPNEKIEDLVLVRADGRPTYNFASPVEDWLDGITHVLRGEDHISNTPKQIQILEALGAPLPRVRAPGEHPRRGRQEALQATRRDLGRGVPRAGLHPRGARQLPRAARLELRRQDDGHVARRARRALHARARRREPGRLRLPEARVAERRLPARAPARRVRRSARRAFLRERGYDWDEALVRKSAPLVQEKIATLGEFPTSPASSSSDVEPDPALLDGAVLEPRPSRRSAEARAVHRRVDRASAPGARRATRAEAARGVSADPRRRHRLEDLARPLREHRAPRPRADARADQERPGGSGLGAASGSSARWKSRQAWRRNPGVGPARSEARLQECLDPLGSLGSRFPLPEANDAIARSRYGRERQQIPAKSGFFAPPRRKAEWVASRLAVDTKYGNVDQLAAACGEHCGARPSSSSRTTRALRCSAASTSSSRTTACSRPTRSTWPASSSSANRSTSCCSTSTSGAARVEARPGHPVAAAGRRRSACSAARRSRSSARRGRATTSSGSRSTSTIFRATVERLCAELGHALTSI